MMKLLTKKNLADLAKNGRDGTNPLALKPVVKLFTPFSSCTWLLIATDEENPDTAYAVADMGQGMPEYGPVSLAEITATSRRGKFFIIERDMYFQPDRTAADYLKEARSKGRLEV